MADAFSSYASKDREHARRVATGLDSFARTVWWDRKIPIERHAEDVIGQALAGAKCLIAS